MSQTSDAIKKIISIQKCYSPLLIDQCKAKPHSNPDGNFMPLQFSPAEDPVQSIPSGEDGIIARIDDGLLDMSSVLSLVLWLGLLWCFILI